MLPLALVAGGIWLYNGIRYAQLRNGNCIKKKDPEDEETKSLTIYKDCTFRHEDKRTFNSFNNCTFNYYITIKKGDEDER